MRFKPVPEPAEPITFKLLAAIEEVKTNHDRWWGTTHVASVRFYNKDHTDYTLHRLVIPDEVIEAAKSAEKQTRSNLFEVTISVLPLDGTANRKEPS